MQISANKAAIMKAPASDTPNINVNSPLIALRIWLAGTGEPVSGLMTTKLMVPFSICTRISSLVNLLKKV